MPLLELRLAVAVRMVKFKQRSESGSPQQTRTLITGNDFGKIQVACSSPIARHFGRALNGVISSPDLSENCPQLPKFGCLLQVELKKRKNLLAAR